MRSCLRQSSGAGTRADPRSRYRRAHRRCRRISPDARRLPSNHYRSRENIRYMTRIYIWSFAAAFVAALLACAASAGPLTRVERGNLTFENIPEPAAELAEKLN